MDSRLLIELLAILALVLANGFFALSEFSVIASRRSRLLQKAQRGKMGATRAVRLYQNPERFLATVQVGITLVGALLGVFSGVTVVEKLRVCLAASSIEIISQAAKPLSVVLVVLAITGLSVILGELVPKYVALSFPERFARYVSGPITVFVRLTSFFSRFLATVSVLLVRLFGIRRAHTERGVTEDEINLMLVEGKETGVFDQTEQEFVRSLFEFSDSTVRRAMKPRADVVGFDIGVDPEAMVKAIVKHGFSRYPVFDGTIDKVIGVIYAKDLIGVDTRAEGFSLRRLLRKPLFVPDSMLLPTLLKDFQKGKNHIALVLDEFGGTFGIITLEDILEELVGEIRDEYDAEAAPIVKHSDAIAYASGTVWPGDINEVLDSRLPEDAAETLAGLFIDTVGRFPGKHESVQIADVRLTVLAKDENRILRLKLEKVADTKDN
ncbi:MAG TPA: hemolysin family protein [Acidobacteriota bacterium]|nr:hemolysin family protein [Acidobacteriota bacterium]